MTEQEADPERTVVERIDARLGRVLRDRYRLDHKLAAGGFGSVYRATDLQRRTAVAIKVLHPELVRDPAVVARFRREASALASLRDPHTVHALDAGEEPDGTLYIVMELLAGESLYECYKARGPLAWQRVVAIARCVCSSLAEAHALGIVHRDLKPANIHLEANDHAMVLDFGIAKILDTSSLIGGDLTMVGQMIGTYDYMPPEQMIGTCTPESDLFTLGVVIYEMIAGRRPFGEARGPAAQLANVIGTTPAPLPNVPPELARIVARCIAREPADRYHDARVLAADLGAVLLAYRHSSPALTNRASRANDFAVGTTDEAIDDVLDRLDNPAFDSTALAPVEPIAPSKPTSDEERTALASPITPMPGSLITPAPITPTGAFDRARTAPVTPTSLDRTEPARMTPPSFDRSAGAPLERTTSVTPTSLDRTAPARVTPSSLERTEPSRPTPPARVTPRSLELASRTTPQSLERSEPSRAPSQSLERASRTTPQALERTEPSRPTPPARVTPRSLERAAAAARGTTPPHATIPTLLGAPATGARVALPGLPPERASAHELPTQIAVPITPLPPTPVPARARASSPGPTPTPNRERPVPLAALDLSARAPRDLNTTLHGVMPAVPPILPNGSSDSRDAAAPRRFATGTTPTADKVASDSTSFAPQRRPSTGFDLERQARRDAMIRLAIWVAILAAITVAALIVLR